MVEGAGCRVGAACGFRALNELTAAYRLGATMLARLLLGVHIQAQIQSSEINDSADS